MSHQRFRGGLEADLLFRIEPLLYRTLLLTRNSPQHKTALLLAAAQRTPAKFTKYVQNLLLWHGPHAECTMLLLSLCSGISRLTLFDPKPAMLPFLDSMRVKHLSISLAQLSGHPSGLPEIDPGRPLFQAITHLELWDTSPLVAGTPIAQLPALTHLCVAEQHGLLPLLSFLKKSDKLCVLVNVYCFQVEFEKVQQDFVDDPRLVLMKLNFQGYVADWVAGAKGGQAFWRRAEKFIAKKKRGEIEPGRLPPIPPPFSLTTNHHYYSRLAVSRCWIVEEDLID
jgi:hypothetical protein